jgi:hypothetical protein
MLSCATMLINSYAGCENNTRHEGTFRSRQKAGAAGSKAPDRHFCWNS